ncbi:hypothetical protein MOQ72_40055 [Saccharopolyspora sp. K220]|uniref:hypothetical protein n=1 Tax=Saccharopolyspora soli TaxID=2926618 RepID=UPI001F571429|nr:hypothetical protein [Saccharopolyspora soli]MCI2423618.1 hypothetical protein [Saccharopolyspora soli]
MPGFSITEVAPREEDGEVWRCLRVRFPPSIVSHSTEQDFYFGPDFLLRRHDYAGEMTGGDFAAQYVSDYIEADEIQMPTKRRAFLCAADGKPNRDALMVSIDFSDVRFE